MPKKTPQEIRKELTGVFKDCIKEQGFYDLVEFKNDEIGFSAKKKFKKIKNRVSLIKVAIRDRTDSTRKILFVSATYGELHKDSIAIRSQNETKSTDPIDLESGDDYFYDIDSRNLYKDNKIISAGDLIEEFYAKHTKTTKQITGLYLRLKMWFLRDILSKTFVTIAKFFSWLLFIMSGTRYSYDPVFGEESVSGAGGADTGGNKKEETGKSFEFFGYEASQWSIVFYSSLHLMLYAVLVLIDYKPLVVTEIMGSNFLVLTYVVVSLWLIESVIPSALKRPTKFFYILSFRYSIKRIKV